MFFKYGNLMSTEVKNALNWSCLFIHPVGWDFYTSVRKKIISCVSSIITTCNTWKKHIFFRYMFIFTLQYKRNMSLLPKLKINCSPVHWLLETVFSISSYVKRNGLFGQLSIWRLVLSFRVFFYSSISEQIGQ